MSAAGFPVGYFLVISSELFFDQWRILNLNFINTVHGGE